MKPSTLPPTRIQSEAEVTKDCVEYLHKLGWRPKRNHVGLFYTEDMIPIRMGEKGEPDWTFLHPTEPAIWIELKATGKEPPPKQHEFIAKLRHFKYRAGWCDSLTGLKTLLAEWGL